MLNAFEKLIPATGKLTISIIGLDGAGKGVYIDRLRQYYDQKGITQKCCYLGYGSFKLYLLRFIRKLRDNNSNAFVSKILLAAYLIVLPFDFLIRRGLGRYDVLITDRHPRYEPIFQGEYIKYFSWYNKIIEITCPDPDVVLYLKGDIEELWKRKKEHQFSVYTEMKKRLESLIRSDAGKREVIEIDTVGDIPNVFQEIRRKLACYE